MFRKEVLFLGALFALILVSNYTTACTPDYNCKEWSSCENAFQTRSCVDKACGESEIVDRRICTGKDSPTCVVKYTCDSWSSCTYYDKANDIVSSQIKYSGIETRLCTDSAGCADGFLEEKACEDAFKVNFIKIQQCGVDFLVAQDPGSKRSLAQINLDAWREQFLDILFVQGNFSYCPSCYNEFRDGNETGIDCGGSCGSCKVENNRYVPIVLSSWILAVGLFFSFLGTFVGDKKYVLRFVLYRAYVAIERRDIRKLRKLSKRVNSLYSQLSNDERQAYTREVSRFKDRLEDFRIRISRENEK